MECSALTKFYLNYTEETTICTGLGNYIPFTSSIPVFPTQSAIAFQNNNTNADMLEGCKLVELIAELI